MADPEEAELRALLTAAEEAVARAVAEARLKPEVAAAACAVLAGEYAAVVAAGRRLPPGPVLDEAARVLRRRGEAVHRALRSEEEGDAGNRGSNPRRRLWRQAVDVGGTPSEAAALPGGEPTSHVDSLAPLIATGPLRRPLRPARPGAGGRGREADRDDARRRQRWCGSLAGGVLAGLRGRTFRRNPGTVP
jgi:hypothetical protein